MQSWPEHHVLTTVDTGLALTLLTRMLMAAQVITKRSEIYSEYCEAFLEQRDETPDLGGIAEQNVGGQALVEATTN